MLLVFLKLQKVLSVQMLHLWEGLTEGWLDLGRSAGPRGEL